MLKGPVASATIRTTFVLGLRLVLQAGTLLLIARVLGPSLFGAYVGIAALAILLGTLSTFGTHIVLLAEASHVFHRRLRVLPYCLSTTLIVSTLLLALFLALILLLFPDSPLSLVNTMVIGITEVLVQPLLAFPSVQLQAQRKIVASQITLIIPLSIRFLIALAVFVNPVVDGLSVIIIGNMLASIAGLIIASLPAPDIWPSFRHWRIAKWTELRRAAVYAVINLTAVGPAEIDKSLAARLLTLSTAGVYSGAARIISAFALPVNAMVSAVLPTLFHEAQTAHGIRPRVLGTMFVAALLYGSAASILMWVAVPAVVWLFGDAYAGIGQAVSMLCIAIPGITLRLTGGAVLMARNRPWARVFFEVSGIAVLLLASIVFAPRFGISGMIGAYIAAEWTMAFVAAAILISDRNPANRRA